MSINISGTIFPVIVMNREPIKVWIAGGQGLVAAPTAQPIKPPLEPPEKKKTPSVFDSLPKSLNRSLGSGEKIGRSVESALSKAGSSGLISGGAGLAAGVAAAGLSAIKSAFIDPLVGAAKGGLQTGINRGMGVEVLSRSFEVLGTQIGVVLLPTVITLAASAMAAAKALSSISEKEVGQSMDKWGNRALGPVGWIASAIGFNPYGSVRKNVWGIDKDKEEETKASKPLTDKLGNVGLGPLAWGAWALGFNPAGGIRRNVWGIEDKQVEKFDADKAKAKTDVLGYLQRSLGSTASYQDITSVRQQAQLAALNADPFEAQIKRTLLEGMTKLINEIGPNIQKTAENTAPKS